jgi:hypothetical protein
MSRPVPAVTVMAPAPGQVPDGCMTEHSASPAQHPGKSQRPSQHAHPSTRLFLAPDHRPPLAGIKLVRPRPAPLTGAYRLRALQLDPGPRDDTTGSDEESHHNTYTPTRRPSQVTGSDLHALLTARPPMGAQTPWVMPGS